MDARKRMAGLLMGLFIVTALCLPFLAHGTDEGQAQTIIFPADKLDLVDIRLQMVGQQPELADDLGFYPAPEGQVAVILQLSKPVAQAHLDHIEAQGGTVKRTYQSIDMVYAEVPFLDLPALTGVPDLVRLEPKIELVPFLASSVPAINVDEVWSQFGFKGQGMTIAVLDTGINANHEYLDDLDDNPTTDDPKIALDEDDIQGFYNAVQDQMEAPHDTGNHGSHCTGIACGTGGAGRLDVGVAPLARMVGVITIDQDNGGSDGEGAIDWTKDNADRFSIDVASMSFGQIVSIPGLNNGNSGASVAVDELVDAGVVAVVAAGNGQGGACLSNKFGISVPGDAEKAITVGWADDNGNRNICSSQGPTGDGRIKPDVMAPGSGVDSAKGQAGNTGSRSSSGSSMSTPHVAGLVALMLEANPDLNPALVKQILHETSDHQYGVAEPYSPNNEYGWGFVDGWGAVKRGLDLRSGEIEGDGTIQTATSQTYSVSMNYTKTEHTYKGEDGTEGLPYSEDEPDVVRLLATIPNFWPEPSNAVLVDNSHNEVTVDHTTEIREEGDNWLIESELSYTGLVSAGVRATSFPTLSFDITAPDEPDQIDLVLDYRLNNMPGRQVTMPLVATAEPPDLTVSKLEASNENPEEGEDIRIDLTVSNIGEGLSLSSNVEVYEGDPDDGGVLLETFSTDRLDPTVAQAFALDWNTADKLGENTLVALVKDSNPAEQELDNNELSLTIEVKEAEIPNTAPTLTIDSPRTGEIVDGTISVGGEVSDPDEDDTLEVSVRILPNNWVPATLQDDLWSWEWDTEEDLNGDYTLQAQVFDGEAYSDIAEVTVTVDNEGANTRPTADLTADPLEIKVEESVTFDGSASTDDNEVKNYFFDFGDGVDSGWRSVDTIEHTYSTAGEYTATLTVEDEEGARSVNSAEVTITVTEYEPGENRPPVARIDSPNDGTIITEGEELFFDGRDSLDPDAGDTLTFEWVTDEGAILLSTLESFYYQLPVGIYNITLTVDDGRGGVSEARAFVIVLPEDIGGGGGDDDDDSLPGPGAAMVLVSLAIALLSMVGWQRYRT